MKNIAIAAGTIVAVLVAAAVVLILVWDWNWFLAAARDRAGAATGRSVEIGAIDVDWDWSTPEITLDDVKLGNAEWAEADHMLAAERIHVRIDIWDSLFGNYVLPELKLVKPVVNLEKSPDGTGNWALGDNLAADAALETVPEDRGDMPQIGRLVVEDGALTYVDPGRDIDLESRIATVVGDTDEERIELEGEGRFEGKAFSLDFLGGSLLSLRDEDKPYPVAVDAEIGATRISVEGTVTRPFDLKGLDLTLDIAGQDMAEIFPIFGIPLPSTPPYGLTGKLAHDGAAWAFRDFAGTVGDSDLAGDLTVEPGETRPFMTAELVSERLDFDDLAGFIGAEPETGEGETASASQQEEAAEEAAEAGILPDTPVDLERLRAMDMDVHYVADEILAPGYALEQMDAVLRLRDGLAVLDPLRFDIAGGSIAGTVELDGRSDNPEARADLTLDNVLVSEFFRGSVFAEEMGGALFGHIELAGAGASLADMLAASDGRLAIVALDGRISAVMVELIGLDIAETLSLAITGEDPALDIDCLAVDFAVASGIGTTKTLLLDTSDSLVVGEGTVDLGRESMEVTILAEPKDFSILSLNAPVFIDGTFDDPSYGVSPEAVLPKIDFGLGDDAPDYCAKLREAL